MNKSFCAIMAFLLVFMVFSFPALASSGTETDTANNIQTATKKNPYTDTINAVFDRLNGKVFEKPAKITPGGYEVPEEEQQSVQQGNTSGTNSSGISIGQRSNNSSGGKHIIPGIPDFHQDSVLEKMKQDMEISSGDIVGAADKIGTSIHNTVSQWLIALAPILLVIAAVMMLFSSARAFSFLIVCGVVIFVIIFAPELVQMFITSISNIFH